MSYLLSDGNNEEKRGSHRSLRCMIAASGNKQRGAEIERSVARRKVTAGRSRFRCFVGLLRFSLYFQFCHWLRRSITI